MINFSIRYPKFILRKIRAAELSIINTGEYPIIEGGFGCQQRPFAHIIRILVLPYPDLLRMDLIFSFFNHGFSQKYTEMEN